MLYHVCFTLQKQVAITLNDVPLTAWSDRIPLKTIDEANAKIPYAQKRVTKAAHFYALIITAVDSEQSHTGFRCVKDNW